MENKYVVYLHYTKDNNKVFYVGEGTIRRSKTRSGRNIYWQRVVAKHGFTVKIIANNLTKIEALKLEKLTIKGLKRTGYNLTNLINSSIGNNNIGKKNPKLKEWNIKHSGKLHPMYGTKRPDTALRNKLTASTRKRTFKPVRCIETGLEFPSLISAVKYCGRKKHHNLSEHLTGKRKTAFGFTWEFINVLNQG